MKCPGHGLDAAVFLFGAISAAWVIALAFLLRDTPQVRGDGKVSFRGFRGRYRLTWKGADGKKQSMFVELQ